MSCVLYTMYNVHCTYDKWCMAVFDVYLKYIPVSYLISIVYIRQYMTGPVRNICVSYIFIYAMYTFSNIWKCPLGIYSCVSYIIYIHICYEYIQQYMAVRVRNIFRCIIYIHICYDYIELRAIYGSASPNYFICSLPQGTPPATHLIITLALYIHISLHIYFEVYVVIPFL